ncbi:MAG: hypothetical protein HQK98_05225 [Nitrospirae bacterium]|nr:hypothetical protein [Nitrospirota bacterium]
MKENKYFLPYQIVWLKDNSLVKIWEKSRRIGATYMQSYEDVRDCVADKVPSVWFSSADESAAKEYILYCEQWAKLFDKAAKYLGQVVLDSEKDIKAFVVKFANGTRIHAISSNPKAFRSKGGKVVLDEFAWHEDQERLWAAAKPCITWGYPLRILSTHNGTNCRYYKFIESTKKEQLKWSLHTTPIQTAVEQGLVDKIYKRPTTQEERDAWLTEQRASCFDENTWLQEYCCIAVDEASAFLTYEILEKCTLADVISPLEQIKDGLFVGMDIGRKKDLTVIWCIEKIENIKYTRMVKVIEKTPFHLQRKILFEILKHPMLRRACIDATGIGMQLAEEAQLAFGKYRIEAVTFSAKIKEDLAYGMRNDMEDRQFYIPDDFDCREDFHSVRKVTTTAGAVRFDVAASEARGHADRFWACALARYAAADTSSGPINVATRRKRETTKFFRGYD